MKKEKKYPYASAYAVALEVVEQLRPHCERIEIAGSVRRKKAEVSDIEVVAIPKPYSTGLFEDGLAKVVNQWKKIKGEMEYGKTKYTQRILPSGHKLDLFLVEEGSWGLQLAIRTGPAEYSENVLAKSWVRHGLHSKGGYLYDPEGEKYEIREEKDFFRFLRLPYTEPEDRHWKQYGK